MSELPEPDPVAADRRRNRRRANLPPDAACALCGINDINVLLPPDGVKGEPLLESHHVLGQAASEETRVVLCRNCHAQQTGQQHDHKALPPLGRGASADSMVERIARALKSLAVFFHSLAHSLATYSSHLLALAAQLDLRSPGWRDWGVAQ